MHLIPEALVLDIQRMSTEDGPGLRTTVFLKGCSLHCAWCHNPESISAQPVIQWSSVKCIGCGSCRAVCAHNAIKHDLEEITIDGGRCALCLTCISECPSGALNLKGERYELTRLLKELLKDRAYFGTDGGITISGGEPLLQSEAVLWLLRELKKERLQTALDTAGLVPKVNLLKVLPYCDLLLYDIKMVDSVRHRELTGSGSEKILENLLAAVAFMREQGKRLWIRTPIIPGATDNAANIAAIGAFIAENLSGQVERWELCAFNNLCENKYRLLGLPWPYKEAGLMSRMQMDELTWAGMNELKNTAVQVIWTGAVKPEAEEVIN
jgi:pyruvate formate lyase activating enzyme